MGLDAYHLKRMAQIVSQISPKEEEMLVKFADAYRKGTSQIDDQRNVLFTDIHGLQNIFT